LREGWSICLSLLFLACSKKNKKASNDSLTCSCEAPKQTGHAKVGKDKVD
jgi:hypothetical protein